jgi:methyl-accepting chemotaxis protein
MKLGVKLLAAPVLTAVVVLIAGQINTAFMAQAAAKSQSTSSDSLVDFKTTANVQEQLGQIHSGVYKTLVLIGSMDDANVKTVRADLATQLAAVARVAEPLGTDSNADDSDRAAIAELKTQLLAYGKQADSAIDLSTVDANTGVAAMLGAETTFISLKKTTAAMQAHSEARGQAQVDAAVQKSRTTTWLMALAALLAAGLAVLLSWLTQKKMVAELARAANIAKEVAAGNLVVDTSSDRQDEVGDLMRALAGMESSLVRVVTSVRQGSEGVSTASAEIAAGNHDLSSRTESQASALEQTAASMEQLSGAVKQNAESARQANQLAMNASTVAVQGGEVVTQVVETMKGINESSRKIADIISVIDGIAFQTNILALNAAVEAARAGEQGRGFAVVASEVRSLAGRSAEAAKEIKNLINASVERVEQGTKLVDQAGSTMTEVVSSIRRVTDLMGEITASSNEQSLGVAQVGEAVTHMDQATQQNAALVEEMAAAASGLKSQAQELVQVVAVFRLGEGRHAVQVAPRIQLSQPRSLGAPMRQLPPARKPLAKAPALKHTPAKPVQKALAKPAVAAKVTPAGGDEDWETF